MLDLYPVIRPALFSLPEEAAREFAFWALRSGLGRLLVGRSGREPDPQILAQRLWGLDFPNPVGLAAGVDKDARVPDAMRRLGFGFVEVGTVTPLPQPGHPKPRVFRLVEDEAVINHMGFNSDGLDAVTARLSAGRGRPGIVGLNLGKNAETADPVTDYEEGIRRAAGFADYLVINISSPNTPGLRDLQRRAALDLLLRRLLRVRDFAGSRPPLLVKIAPDLTAVECEDIAQIALDSGIDGLIVANTTVARPAGLKSENARRMGGLSGRPLFTLSTELLAEMYRLTQARLPLIGVGGVATAADAYAKIRAGASLVQLHTALIFGGWKLVERIKTGLVELLRQDGFTSVAEAVGTAHDTGVPKPPAQLSERVISEPAMG
jgi:dihydroorotate dehydrogenase